MGQFKDRAYLSLAESVVGVKSILLETVLQGLFEQLRVFNFLNRFYVTPLMGKSNIIGCYIEGQTKKKKSLGCTVQRKATKENLQLYLKWCTTLAYCVSVVWFGM